MNLDFNAIQGLIEVSDRCDISELVIEYDGVKIEIRRDRKKDGHTFVLPSGAVYEPPAVQTVQSTAKVSPPVKETEEDYSQYYKVLSPLVGVFYRAPWPGAPPFAEPGDKVSAGQTLCIVEAMKLMNEIKSEIRGKVIEILVENAEPVEFGQPLFLIEPL